MASKNKIKQPNFRSRYATQLTREGKLDMSNRKPFRTGLLKEAAKASAQKVNGTWVTPVRANYHPKVA